MKVKHDPPTHSKSVLDERLAYAKAHAPGGHLIIDQSDFELFEPWDRPWNGCPLTALPGGRFIVHPPGYKPRKPSLRKMITTAEKAGKDVRSVTMPDGTMLHFGTPAAPDEAGKAWDEALAAKRGATDAKAH